MNDLDRFLFVAVLIPCGGFLGLAVLFKLAHWLFS